MPISQQAVGSLAVLLISISLFIFLAVSLFKFLRLVWTRLPVQALSIEGPNLDKLISVTIALIIVPGIAVFAWATAQSFFFFIADQIRRLASLGFSTSVACTSDSISCLATGVNGFVGQMADGLVRALNFSSFRVEDFVLFLLIAVLVTQVVGQLRTGLAEGRAAQWVSTTNEWFPKQTRERVVFAGLVLIAFYLGLSALLAIPLFQDKSQSQNLTVDALDKAMDPNVIKAAEFDKIFPEALPAMRDVADPKLADSPVAAQLSGPVSEFFLSSKTLFQRVSGELQDSWGSLRQSALNDQVGLREQAKSAFASGLEVGIGRKQTAQHYYDLFLWHQSVMQRLKNSLHECQTRASSFNNLAGQALESTRTDLQAVSSAEDLTRRAEEMQRKLDSLFPNLDAARTACHPATDGERNLIPRRNSFVESLGAVGSWSKWLLSTEQMPVVIIVGLVGFSLLGATVSRAVRARQADPDGPSARLSVDDLVTVVAVGTTSAVVVFLAAYGGLAVLGGNTGDPNPYVLFATCLIGAVYSEDVWTWARTKGVSNRNQPEDNGDKPRSETPIEPGDQSATPSVKATDASASTARQGEPTK